VTGEATLTLATSPAAAPTPSPRSPTWPPGPNCGFMLIPPRAPP